MKKQCILIAHNNRKTIERLTRLLNKGGYKIVYTNNGIETIKKAFLILPDMVLLSSTIRGMNGYQVYRVLKNDTLTSPIPIIMFKSQKDLSHKYLGFNTISNGCIFIEERNTPKLLESAKKILEEKNKGTQISYPLKRGKNVVKDIDIISKLNALLDKKFFEVSLFNKLKELMQNIFYFEDIALAIMEIFARLEDYSLAAIAVKTKDECKLLIKINKQLNAGVFLDARKFAINRLKKEDVIDISKMEITLFGKDKIERRGVQARKDLDETFCYSFSTADLVNIGFLILGQPKDKVGNEKREIFRNLVSEACTILTNSFLYRKLFRNVKSLAMKDGLTDLYNHNYIIGLMDKEFARAKRYNLNLSLLMLDIDRFKKINDTFGHKTGDIVLKEIAGIIKNTIRASDFAGRYGGEEFSIILTETDCNKAHIFAERLRQNIEKHSFPNLPNAVKITISVGIASYPTKRCADPETLFTYADQALYRAKRLGRNRVCVKSVTDD